MKLTTIGLTSAVIAVGLVGSIAAYRSQTGQDAVTPASTTPTTATSSAWPDVLTSADRDDDGRDDDD